MIQKKGREGQKHVRDNPCRRNEDQPLAQVAQVIEVYRHRLCPAEPDEEKHERADRVEVLERIEAEPALPLGRLVTHPPCHPAVGQFVDDDGIQKRHGNKDKCQRIAEQKIEQAHGRIHLLPVRIFPIGACFILRRHCQGRVRQHHEKGVTGPVLDL